VGLLIALPLMFFMLYGAVDWWVLLTKHQMAEHVMHKYLTKMQVEGRLSSTDEAALRQDFQRFSCPVTDLTGTWPRENQGQARALRGQTVILAVKCRPVPQPLVTGRAVGVQMPDGSYRIAVGGEMLSERVNP
jgi:hypothetical protein